MEKTTNSELKDSVGPESIDLSVGHGQEEFGNLSEIYDQIESIADRLQLQAQQPWDLLDDQKLLTLTENLGGSDLTDIAELASSLRHLTLHNVIERISDDNQNLDYLFDEIDYFEVKDSQRILFANRFELCEVIGRGSYGIVYKAFDRNTQREVALKCPRPELKSLKTVKDKFYIEGTSVSKVVHPGLVPLLDIGFSDGTPYLVSRLVNGPNLEQWLEQSRRPISPMLAVQWVKQLAEAIEHLHFHDILHGDLKPSNILLEHPYSDEPAEMPPELLSVRVTDFGSASQIHPDTKKGEKELQGTLCFMAPEQIVPNGVLDPRTDVYAICAILYELLTDRPVFDSDDPEELKQAIKGQKPLPPRKIKSQVPYALNAVVMKGLEKKTEDRFPSAGALAQDLDAWLTMRTPSVLMNEPLVRTELFLRRNWLSTVGLFLTFMILTGIYTWRLGQQRVADQLELERNRLTWWNQFVETVIQGQKLLRINEIGRMETTIDSVRSWPAEAKVQEDPREFGWFYLNKKRESISRIVDGMPASTPHYVMNVSEKYRTVWVGGADGFVREVDPRNAVVLRQKKLQDAAVESIDVSRDGNYLAVGDEAGTVSLFQFPELQLVDRLKIHSSEVSDLKFSQDTKYLLSSSRDGTLIARDLRRPNLIRTITDSAKSSDSSPAFFGMAILPDPDMVAVSSQDGSVSIINMETGELKRKLNGHHDAVEQVVVSTDQKWLVSVSRDRTICCWNLTDYSMGNRIYPLHVNSLEITNAGMGRQLDRFSQAVHISHLNAIAFDTGYGTIELFQIPSGTRMGVLYGHKRPSWALGYLSWSKQLASYSRDRDLRIWDAPLTDSWAGRFTHFSMVPDQNGFDQPLLWDPQGSWQEATHDGQVVKALKSPFPTMMVNSVIFHKNQDWIFFHNDPQAILEKKLVNKLTWFPGPVLESPESVKWEAAQKVIFEKQIDNQSCETILQGHPEKPYSTFLAGDNSLYFIDMSDRQNPEITKLDSNVNGSIFLPRVNEIMVLKTGNMKPRIFNYAKKQWTGDWVQEQDDTDWLTASLSPDNKTLAVHRPYGRLQFWDYEKRELRSQTLIPETGQRRFRELVWCKNSKEIFAALAFKDLFLIDEKTGKVMSHWDFGPRIIQRTKLSQDGQSLWVYDASMDNEKFTGFGRRLTRIYAPVK